MSRRQGYPMAMIPRFDTNLINVRPDTGFDCSDRDGVAGSASAMDLSQCDVALNPSTGDTFHVCDKNGSGRRAAEI